MAEKTLYVLDAKQQQQPAAHVNHFLAAFCDVHLSLVQVDAGTEPHGPSHSSSSPSFPSSTAACFCARRVRHFIVLSCRTRSGGGASGFRMSAECCVRDVGRAPLVLVQKRNSGFSTNTLSFCRGEVLGSCHFGRKYNTRFTFNTKINCSLCFSFIVVGNSNCAAYLFLTACPSPFASDYAAAAHSSSRAARST